MKMNKFLRVLNGLKPLTHAFSNDLESQKIIVSDNKNILKLIDMFSEDTTEPPTFDLISSEDKIINIISQNFLDKSDSFLLTLQKKNETKYSNFLCTFNGKYSHQEKIIKVNQKMISIFKSTSTPILLADPQNLKPLIAFSDNDKFEICEIDENEKNLIKFKKTKQTLQRTPQGIHTSSFIDLTGDRRSNIVLHTRSDSNNYIDIFNYTENNLSQIKSIRLPSDIGPILFSEFINSLASDMIYVSKEGGRFYLNLLPNISMSDFTENFPVKIDDFKRRQSNHKIDEIFANETIKFDLNKDSGTFEPVFKNIDGTPSGIFLADLSGKGIKSVFLTFKDRNSSKYSLVALDFDTVNKVFKWNEVCNFESPIELDYIHSVSICDFDNTGAQNLIITHQQESYNESFRVKEFVTLTFELDIVIQETGIKIFTLGTSKNGNKFYIPGAVVTLVYENEEKYCKTSLSSQTSFLSLQPQKIFIGLGPTNLFINWANLKVPSDNTKINQKDAISFLVPNTLAVFTLNDDSWRVQSFFSKRFFKITVNALIAILVIFMTIFIILSIDEKKKYKLVMSKDSTRTVFNAL